VNLTEYLDSREVDKLVAALQLLPDMGDLEMQILADVVTKPDKVRRQNFTVHFII
jgi:hypothetical protein